MRNIRVRNRSTVPPSGFGGSTYKAIDINTGNRRFFSKPLMRISSRVFVSPSVQLREAVTMLHKIARFPQAFRSGASPSRWLFPSQRARPGRRRLPFRAVSDTHWLQWRCKIPTPAHAGEAVGDGERACPATRFHVFTGDLTHTTDDAKLGAADA